MEPTVSACSAGLDCASRPKCQSARPKVATTIQSIATCNDQSRPTFQMPLSYQRQAQQVADADGGKQQPQQGLRAHGQAEGVQQGDHTGTYQQGDVQPDPWFDRLELA